MNDRILAILLFGLLLMSLLAPFSGLALLMTVLFVSACCWVVWTLVKTLVVGSDESAQK